MQDKSQELSIRREEERERGICIQRSRAAPPRGEEGEEEGEEEEELEIAVVLVQKEIQPSFALGWSRCALVLESWCSRACEFAEFTSGLWSRCNKSGHMKADCPEGVYRFCHGSVDTPTTGVDTGFQTLRQNDEEKVKCVDTASSGVDTRPSSQRTQLTGLYSVSTQPQVVSTLDPVPRGPVCQTGTVDTLQKLFHFKFHLDTWPVGVQGDLPRYPTQDKNQELSARREEERERGICIQRSRAAPPRGEEGEEEEELKIAGVLRFEYFVLCFGAPVLWVGAVVLWCLSRGAQGLVNLLNSQVVFRVGRCAYLLGFFELLNSKRLESSCSSLYCTCASGSSIVRKWT
ncbi:hypothetical protein Taro_046976 [Colocasia esculenta]|uniref:Uncharacterized protein n=1 Tax=Colocasia esculenta TaxID=4460 RepID=A0A843WZY1_COLES|nr:hypothetical protein [Colocasia esculenta]